ncbi:MAG: RHS repeat-associated core domain-containing protein, partial [Holophagales bacterium]|nr:RHS repeat-associated core domain-containing protein [Holophagales bacterium]
EAYTYDANDNGGRTHPADGAPWQDHWNTPQNTRSDTLGRVVETVLRNGPDPATDHVVSRAVFDVEGNVLEAFDPLNRRVFAYVYDHQGRALRIDSLGGGLRRLAFDVNGDEVERRDDKGALDLIGRDALDRMIGAWGRDRAGEAMTRRERLEYGDGGRADQPPAERQASRALNLLGEVRLHLDEAGEEEILELDFKGNTRERVRRVISDSVLTSTFPTPTDPAPNWDVELFRTDWQPQAGQTLDQLRAGRLDSTDYRTSITYDALDRMSSLRYPEAVDGSRRTLVPRYDAGGDLQTLELDGERFVEHVAYDAHGRRLLVALGNGIMTRFAYEPHTLRLARARSEPYTRPDPAGFTFRRAGTLLQDFGYRYDLAGNVLALEDRSPGGGVPGSLEGIDALTRQFRYDPLYRLSSATGRECDLPQAPPWESGPRCADLGRTRLYRQTYEYDAVGNLLDLRHHSGSATVHRQFTLVPGTNRLAQLEVSGSTFDYAHDACGNVVRETTSRHFEWDGADRLASFRIQVGTAEPSVHAQYLYDGGGERVKKLVRLQGGELEITVYIGGFERRYRVSGGTTLEHDELHLDHSRSRLATVRVGPAFPGDSSPAVRYRLAGHLGSSNLTVDDQGTWTNREEFTPYGETSFGGFASKRYRHTGKERDAESGLCYHGARYYAPWLARWQSIDPEQPSFPRWSGYAYAFANPARFGDPSGGQPEHLKEEITDWESRTNQLTNNVDRQKAEIEKQEKRAAAADAEAKKIAGKAYKRGYNRWPVWGNDPGTTEADFKAAKAGRKAANKARSGAKGELRKLKRAGQRLLKEGDELLAAVNDGGLKTGQLYRSGINEGQLKRGLEEGISNLESRVGTKRRRSWRRHRRRGGGGGGGGDRGGGADRGGGDRGGADRGGGDRGGGDRGGGDRGSRRVSNGRFMGTWVRGWGLAGAVLGGVDAAIEISGAAPADRPRLIARKGIGAAGGAAGAWGGAGGVALLVGTGPLGIVAVGLGALAGGYGGNQVGEYVGDKAYEKIESAAGTVTRASDALHYRLTGRSLLNW